MINYKSKLKFLVLKISFVVTTVFAISSCTDEKISPNQTASIETPKLSISGNQVTRITAQRMGLGNGSLPDGTSWHNGEARDIVARPNGVFCVGINDKIHKYNSSTDKWDEWGGTGKRISATKNYVLIRGMNDKIYKKSMSASSSSSWTQVTGSCIDIAGRASQTGTGNGSMVIVGGNSRVYTWNGSKWSKSSKSCEEVTINDYAIHGLNGNTWLSYSNSWSQSSYPVQFGDISSGVNGAYFTTHGDGHIWRTVDDRVFEMAEIT